MFITASKVDKLHHEKLKTIRFLRALANSCMKFIIMLPLILGYSCTNSASDSLIILAAGGSKPAMDEICLEYNRQHKMQVTVSYAGGGDLLQQMQFGDFGDVYIAPEQSFMDTAN